MKPSSSITTDEPAVEHSPLPGKPAANTGLSYERFLKLLSFEPTKLDAYLGDIGSTTQIGKTRAQTHCRYLKLNGNGLPRVSDLADFLANQVVAYSIPRSQIAKAYGGKRGPHDAQLLSALHRKAAKLFSDIATSGEGGELLLFVLTESVLRLPQLLCKMPLKTSSNVHFHGIDGIHGTFDKRSGKLALYWGESKLHKTPSDALGACLESLAPFVINGGGSGSSQRRDLQLLSDNLDLDDADLEAALLEYLDPNQQSFNKLEFRGIGLVGFDSTHYPTLSLPKLETDLVDQLAANVTNWQNSAAYHLSKHNLANICIELFVLPFPSVEEFRTAFASELGIK